MQLKLINLMKEVTQFDKKIISLHFLKISADSQNININKSNFYNSKSVNPSNSYIMIQ